MEMASYLLWWQLGSAGRDKIEIFPGSPVAVLFQSNSDCCSGEAYEINLSNLAIHVGPVFLLQGATFHCDRICEQPC